MGNEEDTDEFTWGCFRDWIKRFLGTRKDK